MIRVYYNNMYCYYYVNIKLTSICSDILHVNVNPRVHTRMHFAHDCTTRH